MIPKIGFNAILLTTQSGGIAEYMLNLIHQFEKSVKNITVFVSSQYASLVNHIQNLNVVAINLPVENAISRTFLEPFVWPQYLKKYNIDLFHSAISYSPLGIKCPSIVTIHDLRVFYYPETYPRLRALYLKKMIPRSIKQANKIITISNFTKSNLVELFNVPEDKIVVIHQGFDSQRYSTVQSLELKRIKLKYNLNKKYILSTGHLEPRKNYSRLIQAYSLLVNEKNIDFDLVIVGREYFNPEELYQLVADLHLTKRIKFLGFVEKKDLPSLYQCAHLYVTASIFEGFGFTPLESMAAKVPVVASNVSSFPEILLNCAEYFDPFNVEDIAEKIFYVLSDENRYAELSKLGMQNVSRFSWEKCANETVRLYSEISHLL